MIKENKWKIAISTLVVLLPMIAGLILWGSLPDKLPSHWNASGELDGWSSKAFAVFAIPGFLAALHLLCVFCTSLDPKVKNQTRKALGMVLWICPFISVLTGAMVYAVSLGARINVATVIMAFCGFMFVVIGNYLPKCKQNYTIGIKVMWALEDEANWNATHRFAGKVWVIGGLALILVSFILSQWAIWIYIAVAWLMALLPVGYSYIYYRKHGKAE